MRSAAGAFSHVDRYAGVHAFHQEVDVLVEEVHHDAAEHEEWEA